jgi:two-component system response regulator HydG
MVRAGSFREDLWYRLNVAVIRVPPLRERREDIPLLASHFMRDVSSRAPSGGQVGLSEAALDALRNYAWPGNVRQLRAAIERASIEAEGSLIDVEHLPPEVTAGSAPDLAASLVALKWQDAIEVGRREAGRRYLQAVVKKHQGRVADAAAYAGVERESFYRLLRKYGVKADGSPDEPEDAS